MKNPAITLIENRIEAIDRLIGQTREEEIQRALLVELRIEIIQHESSYPWRQESPYYVVGALRAIRIIDEND